MKTAPILVSALFILRLVAGAQDDVSLDSKEEIPFKKEFSEIKKLYEEGVRAKCGGKLFEVAEDIESRATKNSSSGKRAVDLLRSLALDAAYGRIGDKYAFDRAFAASYFALAQKHQALATSAWAQQKLKGTGIEFGTAIKMMDLAIDWGGLTMSNQGKIMIRSGKSVASDLSKGGETDPEFVRVSLESNARMLDEIGDSLRKARGEADGEGSFERQVGDGTRKAGEFVAKGTEKAAEHLRKGADKVGRALRRFGEKLEKDN